MPLAGHAGLAVLVIAELEVPVGLVMLVAAGLVVPVAAGLVVPVVAGPVVPVAAGLDGLAAAAGLVTPVAGPKVPVEPGVPLHQVRYAYVLEFVEPVGLGDVLHLEHRQRRRLLVQVVQAAQVAGIQHPDLRPGTGQPELVRPSLRNPRLVSGDLLH